MRRAEGCDGKDRMTKIVLSEIVDCRLDNETKNGPRLVWIQLGKNVGWKNSSIYLEWTTAKDLLDSWAECRLTIRWRRR